VKLASGLLRLSLLGAALLGATSAHAVTTTKRAVPDYDGRGGPPTSPGRKALWVPRVVFSPAYFVSEYVIRRPLGAAITYAERHDWPAAISDFLALNEVHPIGVVPFFLVDFGFEPSFGLYAYWDDAGFKGHQLRLRGSTWGPHWLSGTLTERFRCWQNFEISLTSTLTKRPDFAFYGVGPDTRESQLVRYSGKTAYALFDTNLTFAGRSALETFVGYRGARFGHSDYDVDDFGKPGYQPSLDDAVASGHLNEPAGFRDGYRAPFAGARLVFDSRGKSDRKSGVRLDVSAEQNVDLGNSPTSGWVRYGGSLSAFSEVSAGGRILALSITTLEVDPIGDRPVPFTQLASLGGGRSMPGLRTSRLADRSALVGTLRYSWPIWLSLSGSLQVGVGNVFGARFDGLRPGRGRLSTALGLETSKNRDSVFQALLGFGTETFESGAALDSIRFLIGVRNTF
jgi:hypothetical protein